MQSLLSVPMSDAKQRKVYKIILSLSCLVTFKQIVYLRLRSIFEDRFSFERKVYLLSFHNVGGKEGEKRRNQQILTRKDGGAF